MYKLVVLGYDSTSDGLPRVDLTPFKLQACRDLLVKSDPEDDEYVDITGESDDEEEDL